MHDRLMQKYLTHLEFDELFVQVVRNDSMYHDHKLESSKWLKKADFEISGIKRDIYHFNAPYNYLPNINCPLENKNIHANIMNFFDLYCLYSHKHEFLAAKEYGKMFDIIYDNVIGRTSLKQKPIACSQYIDVTPKNFLINQINYVQYEKYDLLDPCGCIIGTYIEYRSTCEYFYIYGKIVTNNNIYNLVIGRPNGKIPIYNEDALHQPREKIIFDMSVSKVVGLSSSDGNVVHTTCLDQFNLETEIDFSSLHGHNVYFIPDATIESIKKCLKYVNMLEMDSINSIKTNKTVIKSIYIYNVFKKMGFDKVSCKKTYLTASERFRIIELKNEYLSIDRFKYYLQMFKIIKNNEYNVINNKDDVFIKIDWNNEPCTVENFKIDALEEILIPPDITGIIGSSDSGKTLLAYSMACALACGGYFLDIKCKSEHRVLYFDCETSKDKIYQYKKRIENAYHYNSSKLNENFIIKSLVGQIDKNAKWNLVDADFQNRIKECIKESKPKFIFFDNLSKLCDNITSQIWKKINKFFKTISEDNKSVIFCHHLNKKGKISGTEDIKNLSQNIIIVRQFQQVMKNYQNIKNIDNSDCMCELEYIKFKGDPSKREVKQVWRLKYNHSNPCIGDKWECLYPIMNDASDNQMPASSDMEEVSAHTAMEQSDDRITEEKLQSRAIEIFKKRRGRQPKFKGDKKKTDWKQDVLLCYAIKRWLIAQSSEQVGSEWFTLKDVAGRYDSTPENKRNMLDALVNDKLLNRAQDNANAGNSPIRWSYRPAETEEIDSKLSSK